MEGLLMGNYLFVKMNSSIVNRFLTIRTISKGKSSGRPPVSDERVEDLKEMVEKTLQISGDKVFSIFICLHLFSYQFLYTVWWHDGGNNCSPVGVGIK
jgi:hypothetical protein